MVGELIGFPGERSGERWMTKREVARLLGVSERTVARYCRERGLPHRRWTQVTLRFRRSEVLLWMAQR